MSPRKWQPDSGDKGDRAARPIDDPIPYPVRVFSHQKEGGG